MYGNPVPQYMGGDYPSAPKKRGHRKLKIAGIVLGVFMALCCGGVVIAALNSGGKTPAPSASSTHAAVVVASTPAAAVTTKAAPPPPPPAPKVLLSDKGSGIKKTAKFTTGSEWTLNYAFDCSSFGMDGNFAVTEYTDGVMSDVLVNALAAKGSDSVPQHDDPGEHYLEVNSECGWSITVTG